MKANTKIKLLSFVLTVFFVLIIAGCQSPTGSDVESNKDASANVAEDNELDLLVPNYYNNDEKELWKVIVNKFEELNEDIEVKLEAGDVEVESGSLITKLNSGITPPDTILISAGPGRVNLLADAGLVKPLDDLYSDNNWKDSLQESAYNLASQEKEIYELPHTIDGNFVFYNKDIFNEHGLEVPETKEEFDNVLKVLQDNDVTPLTIGARDAYSIGWLYGVVLEAVAGTEKVENTIYKDGKWNDPDFIKAAEVLEKWSETGVIKKDSTSLTYADSVYRFLNKEAAMEVGGTRKIIDINAAGNDDTTGAFVLPSFIEGETANPAGGIGLSWVVPTNAQNNDLVERWFNFVLSEEYSELVLSLPGYNFIPSAKAAQSIDAEGDIINTAIDAVKEGSGYNPSVFIGVETKEAYYQNLQGILGGQISAGEAMDNIQKAAEAEEE